MISLTTLAELPFQVAETYAKPALLRRARADGFIDISTEQFLAQVRELSLGLVELGISPGDRVAIVSESRPEWGIADLAILSVGAVTVPIYPTLSGEQTRYILVDAAVRAAIVSNEVQAAKLQAERRHAPGLEVLVVIDPSDRTRAMTPPVSGMDEIAAKGRRRARERPIEVEAHRQRAGRVQPGDLATIIYTSGTTGEPKGVMLTHANLVSNIRATSEVLPISAADVALSFLPLSHGFERMVFYLYLSHGLTIVFAESLDTIGRDLVAARPTVVTGVPRVYEKIHARILENVARAPALRQRLFHWAVQVGLRAVRAAREGRLGGLLALQRELADRLVFSKIRSRTGGRVRYLVSGSARLAPALGEFFDAVGLRIIEGYGLTETSPVLTVNPVDAPRYGTVGKPIPGVDLRIADDGEILARGPNIMAGYYQKPAATAEAIQDGWFHTGDVGRFDPDGYLVITDRKKDLIVTSGGKKLAPQPIEEGLKRDPLVAEALIVGEGRRFPAVLIVPDFAALDRRLKETGAASAPRETLVTRPDVVALYQERIDQVNERLAQFERLKRFALLPTEFTIQTGELTPTMKIRRRVVEERWKDVLETLYREEAG
jgi:long-chain acyl-CoA synthetase